MLLIYQHLDLPTVPHTFQLHIKEKMLIMIINMIRYKPTLFIKQLKTFKQKWDKNYLPKNFIFIQEDVDSAIQLLIDA